MTVFYLEEFRASKSWFVAKTFRGIHFDMRIHEFRFLQVSVFLYRCLLIHSVGVTFPVLKNLLSNVKRGGKGCFSTLILQIGN